MIMLYSSSYELICKNIYQVVIKSHKRPFLILIGGCSRTGKSTFSLKLSRDLEGYGVDCHTIDLDSWIISFEKRKPNGNVFERYDYDAIVKDIKDIMMGNIVYPPVYDSFSRKRTGEKGEKAYYVSSGIIIVEGVIGLAIKELVSIASLKIFIAVPDEIRVKRLMDFYINKKKLTRNMAEEIICSREKEEVLFVKETSRHADLIFERTR